MQWYITLIALYKCQSYDMSHPIGFTDKVVKN
jgi:hypothetical protein